MQKSWASGLRDVDIILTPNQRLAGYVRDNLFSAEELTAPILANQVLPLSTWLTTLFYDYQELYGLANQETLLTARQAKWVWQKILLEAQVNQPLLNFSSTATLAQEAHKLYQLWMMPEQVFEEATSEDVKAFQQWQKSYQEQCEKNKWLDLECACEKLCQWFKKRQPFSGKSIALVGFNELSPLYQKLFKQIQSLGNKVFDYSLLLNNHSASLASCEDKQEELQSIVQWLNEQVNEKPTGVFGVVVPNLNDARHQINQVFSKQLNTSYNMSAPLPLSSYPIIQAGLFALSFGMNAVTFEEASYFLRSPFFQSKEINGQQKLHLEMQMRRWSEYVFQIEHLKERFKSSEAICCFDDLDKINTGTKVCWIDEIEERLAKCHWPGERAMDSHVFQAYQQWQRLLSEYQALQFVLGAHSYTTALTTLEQLAKEITFLPESKGCQVQVLGVLEALGMPFDGLWVMGMDETVWPATPTPNPFIPKKAAKTYQIPRCDSQRELSVATKMTNSLVAAAKTVVFSFSELQHEGHIQASPLVVHFPQLAIKLSDKPCSPHSHSQLETVVDEYGPPIPKGSLVKGGAKVLQLQSLCPFKAFAEVRLKAKPLEKVTIGLTPRERGELAHQLLAECWKVLRSSDNLLKMDDVDLNYFVNQQVTKTLTHWQDIKPETFNDFFLDVEVKRLNDLLVRVLEAEKHRCSFTIKHLELEYLFSIGAIQLTLRVDRIDTIDNNDEIIIDYKSGQAAVGDWFGDRPKDPQLPLYAISRLEKTKGLAFSKIKSNQIEYLGVCEDMDDFAGVKSIDSLKQSTARETWDGQMQLWTETLEKLSEGVREGYAKVDPIDQQVCRYCQLKSFCRVENKS